VSGLSWKIYCDPVEVGETMGELCVLVVRTPFVVAAELPIDEVPEVVTSEVVVSDIAPVVAAPGMLVDEVPELGSSERVVVVVELLLDVVVPTAGVPVNEGVEVGTSEGVVLDVSPVVAVSGELAPDVVVSDEGVSDELGPVVGDPRVVGID